jgi:hypothetical protein
MRPDCPGASRAGSGDWAWDCDVSTTMLAASMKDIISILGMSVAPFVEQPGRAIESRASRRAFRRTGTDRYGVFCRGLDEIALIAGGILTGGPGAKPCEPGRARPSQQLRQPRDVGSDAARLISLVAAAQPSASNTDSLAASGTAGVPRNCAERQKLRCWIAKWRS